MRESVYALLLLSLLSLVGTWLSAREKWFDYRPELEAFDRLAMQRQLHYFHEDFLREQADQPGRAFIGQLIMAEGRQVASQQGWDYRAQRALDVRYGKTTMMWN